jgi:hypothetical protein
MNMQEDLSELMMVGKMDGPERRRIDLLNNSGEQGNSIKVKMSQGTERNSTLVWFKDSLGDGDNHEENSHGGGRRVGRQGDVRDGKGAKDEAAFPNTCDKAKVLQQVDEKAANNHHGEADNGYRSREIGDQNGVTELGRHSKEAGKGSTSGNIEWISSAGEAQEAITRVFQEQAPGIGYCHECGWWHELPRSYSFKTLGRSRRRQHR